MSYDVALDEYGDVYYWGNTILASQEHAISEPILVSNTPYDHQTLIPEIDIAEMVDNCIVSNEGDIYKMSAGGRIVNGCTIRNDVHICTGSVYADLIEGLSDIKKGVEVIIIQENGDWFPLEEPLDFESFGVEGIDNIEDFLEEYPELSSLTCAALNLLNILFGGTDGNVYGLGRNPFCQLGEETELEPNNVVMVPGITDVTELAATLVSCAAIRDDGTIWRWGFNDYTVCDDTRSLLEFITAVLDGEEDGGGIDIITPPEPLSFTPPDEPSFDNPIDIGTNKTYNGMFAYFDYEYIQFEITEADNYDIIITGNEITAELFDSLRETLKINDYITEANSIIINAYLDIETYFLFLSTDYEGALGFVAPYKIVITKSTRINRTAGLEYEQVYSDIPDLDAPSIDNVNVDILDFVKGIYQISISPSDCTLDLMAEPFFFLKAAEGTFSFYTLNGDGSMSVIFAADPETGGRNVRVVVGVGDGLGQVDRREVLLKGNDE